MKNIKKAYYLLFLLIFISFSTLCNAQCIKNINGKMPYYRLVEPTKTFVDEVKNIDPDEIAFVDVKGDVIGLYTAQNKSVMQVKIKFDNESSEAENDDIITSFDIKKSKQFSNAKVIYRLREGCYDCRVELYNKKGVLLMKFFSDEVEAL